MSCWVLMTFLLVTDGKEVKCWEMENFSPISDGIEVKCHVGF